MFCLNPLLVSSQHASCTFRCAAVAASWVSDHAAALTVEAKEARAGRWIPPTSWPKSVPGGAGTIAGGTAVLIGSIGGSSASPQLPRASPNPSIPDDPASPRPASPTSPTAQVAKSPRSPRSPLPKSLSKKSRSPDRRSPDRAGPAVLSESAQRGLRAIGLKIPPLRSLLDSGFKAGLADGRETATELFGGATGWLELEEFRLVTTELGLPASLALPMFLAAGAQSKTEKLPYDDWARFWDALPDELTAAVVKILRPTGPAEIRPEDFVPVVQYVLETHPGLAFLAESPEFGPRYVETVTARVFYKVDRSSANVLTANSIRKSNLLGVLSQLDREPDINLIDDYFSYQHFYVIYTTFWKLDSQQRLRLSKSEFERYGGDALTHIAVDRVFALSSLNCWARSDGLLSYRDFVYFMLSEEDKCTLRGTRYWFEVLDLDGDGELSFRDLEQFYRSQAESLDELGVEAMQFPDVLCQMHDLLQTSGPITLPVLRRAGHQAEIFINTMTNPQKQLAFEDKDPFANDPSDGQTESAWDKFASLQYDLLAAEEDETDNWSDSDSGKF